MSTVVESKSVSKGARRGNRSPYLPKGRQTKDSALEEIRVLLGDAPRQRDMLIEYLHLIQDHYKQVSAEHMAALAEEMRLAMTEVYEVATFYHHFNVTRDAHSKAANLTVRVCDGISCEMRGAHNLLEDLTKKYNTEEGVVRVIHAPCVGACDRAPIAVVGQRQLYHADNAKTIAAIEARNDQPDRPEYQGYLAYIDNGGYTTWKACKNGERSREDVISMIDSSGLRGLGGAGFPTARKWSFLENTPKPRIVAINADEGEPGTFKDRYCFETAPHRVLEGILIAAWAVEADTAYIYLRDEYPQVRTILLSEIAQLEDKNMTGGIKLHLRRGAGAYICGEESAMLESIEGKRGIPRNRPPFPAQAGLFGLPTLINNVETMYWISAILENGPDWYHDKGRPHFYSVSGRIKEPGVKLAPAGTTARQLINEYCGGMEDGHTFNAYLPGGASGGLLPAEKGDLPLDFGALDEYGCFIGSSAVVVFSNQDNIRDICRNLINFFEYESCGQCTPCRVGCEKMMKLISQPRWDIDLIQELCDTMQDASICGLGQAAPNPVLSALRFFEEDVK
ncbi:MAG: NADH-quinone oxidoreductase subunit F [Rhodospirillaceae bacterium TMED8]|nr:NADH-quinone oxidoreductase subunit F [Magnetovibrio sp.]OUT50078.1 MAG: NADH-quinone oxidoreductase subunit F [Rhodospirillaceae bacterium TMED8]|tara:strand:+ start:3485 stop:5179 length:1695 start_codon:yes stop_codon:yes gene_type:complete